MASSQQFGRFLAWSGAVTVMGAAACAALVVAVDPYRLYGMPQRPGFNQVKTQPERYQKEIKLAAAQRSDSNVFIVGNSRAEIGLDPDDLAGPGMRPYNLALAGTRIQVAREQLEQLHRARIHPRHLIVGAEFLDAPLDPARPRPPAPPTVYPGPGAELAWRFDTLFSLDALADAFKTVRQQRNENASTMSARGFNPLREYRQLAREEGYYALFRQRATDYAKRFARLPRSLADADGRSPEFEQLRAVVAHGAGDGARVDVVIYPYHAQLMALIDAAGMAPLFDQWRTRLAREIEAEQAAHPGVRITLWDFSGYGPYQCEPIPAKGDRRSDTAWYWEGGHFKAALGQRMLARIGDQPQQDRAFGMVLDSASLDANRARLGRERAHCQATNGALFSEAAALMPAR